MRLGKYLEFETAFPGEEPLTPQEYLKGGSRKIILHVAAFFLGFKPYNSKYSDNGELLRNFFREENRAFAESIFYRINELELPSISGREKNAVRIINTYSSLRLFECFFLEDDEDETQTEAEFERNIFKAYLVLNSELTRKQDNAIESINDVEEDLKLPMWTFCSQYPIWDKSYYDLQRLSVTQIVKAIQLFQFLETNGKTQPLLSAFLQYFDCNTWIDYLKNLLPLAIAVTQNKREAHTDIHINLGEKFNEGCSFVEKLVVGYQDEFVENDFLTLRERPFYKIEDGVYRIIFNLFVVEKIFKGMYFLLRDVNEKLPKEYRMPELKSVYGYEFSEQTLLYNVVKNIYSKANISYSGKEMSDMHIDGAPDYYIRKGRNILLFESKDFLIRADRKVSFDYGIYESEFKKILYYEELSNGKIKNGAIMQLINCIRRLLRNEFLADKDYRYKDVFIFPILITHDNQYDVPGLNCLINNWFQQELKKVEEEGFFIHNVKPLVIANIDSLIFHEVGLSKNLSLHDALKLFEGFINPIPKPKFDSIDEWEKYILSKQESFSSFLDAEFNKRRIKNIPPIFNWFREEIRKGEQKI